MSFILHSPLSTNMEYISFPLSVDSRGRLQRASEPIEGLMCLIEAITGTSAGAWRGFEKFGGRELFIELQKRQDARLPLIRSINETLVELGIDWVKVDDIKPVPSDNYGAFSYQITFSYPSQSQGNVGFFNLKLET